MTGPPHRRTLLLTERLQKAAAFTSKQKLALAICEFLSTSSTDGTLTADDKDSIDVAVNCIAESFKVDPTDKAAVASAIGAQNLLQIYSVYEVAKSRNNPAASASASASTPAAAAAATPASEEAAPAISEEKKREADGLKSQGNAAMAQKDYTTAIDLYTQALALHPRNAVFLSNRAAAHSAAKDHASAKTDAEAAVAIDPAYTKAWSRLGLARFALGDAKGAMEAYAKGIEYEGNGGSDAMKKGYETAKRRVEETSGDAGEVDDVAARGAPGAGAGGMPDFASLASMFGGAGAGGAGGAGAGGMPDLSSIMSNPMFASMAQNLMSNPEMINNLMSNPRIRDMANQFGSGGGMPDLNSLMSDPNVAEMARNMMGGGGAPPGGAGGPGAGR
ncbi:Small glutamine-rich tetratricopeptide repeat-containing protein 2 [Beauveria bassiana D1-5]|uniref:Small glutamine-rich tetratricopeptide repeat-containing protein 2 n=1 Tax=Beauveria bassiana D1-5 TaxID=1245745 RepID=A0A0A2VK09_BEABA|nr:Small glutamine-rich tetratricopeptide repeat-containing protein 2 [Beauveria bassiana D1-5]